MTQPAVNVFGELFKRGDLIIRQGEIGDCLFIIQMGSVEVIAESGEKEVKLTELGPGQFFGEMGLFEQDVRSCSIRAVSDTQVMRIDKRNFYHTIQKDPSLAFRLLEMMSHRLRQTNLKIAELQKLINNEV